MIFLILQGKYAESRKLDKGFTEAEEDLGGTVRRDSDGRSLRDHDGGRSVSATISKAAKRWQLWDEMVHGVVVIESGIMRGKKQ